MLEYFPNIPPFQDLESAQIDLLKPLFEEFTCPANRTVFEQGEPANFLYFLIKGKVAIRFKPYDSPSIILTHLQSGDVFGWSAVIGSATYTSSIISESSLETLRIRGSILLKLVREHPDTGKIIMDYLANVVSSRWKNAHAQVQTLLNSNQSH
jgi:CRP-like cAMP-binding protein